MKENIISKGSFWLATASCHKEAMAINQSSFEGAVPIFKGKPFDPVMTLSPWIAPLEALSMLPDTLLHQGILLTAKASQHEVISHLQSLLIAFLNGNEVLFRFYDPDVLKKMIVQFTPCELNAFLGNIQTINLWDNSTRLTFSQSVAYSFIVQTNPWWRIQPEHMTSQYQVDVHALGLERRLWEKCPTQMRLSAINIRQVIHNALEIAQHNQAPYDDAELYAMSQLIKHGCISDDTLFQALSITNQEQQQLNTLGERYSWV